jgi:hypothetical protein
MAVDAEYATVAVPVFVTEIAAVALAVAPAPSSTVTEIVKLPVFLNALLALRLRARAARGRRARTTR